MPNIIYEPTIWVNDETVGTAEVFNNIEQGVKKVVDAINSGEVGGGSGVPVEGLPEGESLEVSTNQDINAIFNT